MARRQKTETKVITDALWQEHKEWFSALLGRESAERLAERDPQAAQLKSISFEMARRRSSRNRTNVEPQPLRLNAPLSMRPYRSSSTRLSARSNRQLSARNKSSATWRNGARNEARISGGRCSLRAASGRPDATAAAMRRHGRPRSASRVAMHNDRPHI